MKHRPLAVAGTVAAITTVAGLALATSVTQRGLASQRQSAREYALDCGSALESAVTARALAATRLAAGSTGGWSGAAGDWTASHPEDLAFLLDNRGAIVQKVLGENAGRQSSAQLPTVVSGPASSPRKDRIGSHFGENGQAVVWAIEPVPGTADPERATDPTSPAAWSAVGVPLATLLQLPSCAAAEESSHLIELRIASLSGSGVQQLHRPGTPELERPITVELDFAGTTASLPGLPGSNNSLSLVPARGWMAPVPQGRHMLLATALGLLAGAFAHVGLRTPEHLRREIEAADRKNAEANRRWLEELRKRRDLEESAARNMREDALTGLPSRAYLLRQLSRALERARHSEAHQVAVVMIGIDRFKNVNDSLGYGAGDRLLRHLARRLETSMRPGDEIARLGGDHFALLLYTIDSAATAYDAAEQLRLKLRSAFDVDGHEIFVSASCGVHLAQKDSERPEDSLTRAETALHEAKGVGGNRTVLFNPASQPQAGTFLQLESDIRRALEGDQFKLAYQPIVSLESGGLVGFEALTRWLHPVDGIVPPLDFIPLAEETGLIVPLTRWVLKSAVDQLIDWRANGVVPEDLYLTINLSPRDFDEPDLCEFVGDLLRASGLPKSAIRLELTESVLARNAQAAGERLDELRSMGVQLLLDDFGTGYSSLAYLDRFKFDYLKIDRSFVQRLGAGEPAIVRAIIDMARHMEIKTVAEGLDSWAEADQLRQLGCQYAQGFLYAKPAFGEHIPQVISDLAPRLVAHA